MDIEAIRRMDVASEAAFKVAAPMAYEAWLTDKELTARAFSTGLGVDEAREKEIDSFVRLVQLIVTCGFPLLPKGR